MGFVLVRAFDTYSQYSVRWPRPPRVAQFDAGIVGTYSVLRVRCSWQNLSRILKYIIILNYCFVPICPFRLLCPTYSFRLCVFEVKGGISVVGVNTRRFWPRPNQTEHHSPEQALLTVTRDVLHISELAMPSALVVFNPADLQGRALVHGQLPGALRFLSRRGFFYLTAGPRGRRRAW